MRSRAAVLCVLLVVLAGCSAPFSFGGGDTTSGGPSSPEAGGAGGSEAGGAGAPGTATATADAPVETLADPADDTLGWEGGYWHNESIPVTGGDGLNASEQSALVNRTMARIERVRNLEFNGTVPVEVISRDEFQNRPNATGSGARSPAFRTFDNAKFEGLFLIGENNNSLAVQQSNRNQNVLGYYSPRNDSIVVVSESATPLISRSTLAHELTHALQDQQFNLSEGTPPTRDGYNARNGLIEGEANYVQRRYESNCGGQWRCLDISSGGGGSGGGGLHLGVYALEYFPYADGPAFVDSVFDRAGWQGVNALHADVPESSEQVINPRKYGNDTPTNLTIRGSNSAGWERVRPDGRPDYATLGQSALSAMFGYTIYDSYNESPAIRPQAFLNTEGRSINRTDPFEYGLAATNGWDGDRMAVYEKNNQTGYVWKLAWDSPAEAREFVRGYRELLTHWGGERVLGRQGVWEIERASPFADAFRISQQGNTVIIVNAPQPGDLSDVHERAGG
jgi:hypothetical protein